MAENSVTVVAKFLAKTGQEAPLKAVLTACIAPSRKDAGSLSYDLYESVQQPGQFVMLEHWANKDFLAQHLETPHLKELVAKSTDLLTEPMDIKLFASLPDA